MSNLHCFLTEHLLAIYAWGYFDAYLMVMF